MLVLICVSIIVMLVDRIRGIIVVNIIQLMGPIGGDVNYDNMTTYRYT